MGWRAGPQAALVECLGREAGQRWVHAILICKTRQGLVRNAWQPTRLLWLHRETQEFAIAKRECHR
eukprot:scaffold111832_cov24-Prasinocladus_malaysianus.AAC.1